MGELGAEAKKLSILLVCYGDYPGYSVRAIDSIVRTPQLTDACEMHVACNACCPETLQRARQCLDEGLVTSLVESRLNRHKDPMLRQLIELASAPFALFMDDDSHLKEGWLQAILAFLEHQQPFDVAGKLFWWPRDEHYQQVARKRPWWRGEEHIEVQQREKVMFCTGGLFLARLAFLRQHDWPDRDMLIEYDDTLLGDLVHQHGGIMKGFSEDLLNRVAINDADRRWDPQSLPGATRPPVPAPAQQPNSASSAQMVQVGLAHQRSGRLREAESLYQQVLAKEPNNPNALHLLGMVAHQRGHDEQALDLVSRSIAARPNAADYHNNLGNILAKLNRLEEACDAFRRAVELRPQYAEALNNLALTRSRQEKHEEAAELYRRAVALKADYLEAWCGLGNVLRRLGQLEQAAEACDKAIGLHPRHPEALSNLAMVKLDLGRPQEALALLDRAVEMKPDHAHARLNRALVLLSVGQWQKGWEEYEWRWQSLGPQSGPRRFVEPTWDGRDAAGKTILLHCEQGLGSTIQFIRFAPTVAAMGAKVLIECPPPLKPLLCTLGHGIQVFGRGEPMPTFDVQAPVMSLPRILSITLDSLPARVPYLKTEPKRVEQWRQELAAVHGFKVGIAWQGNLQYGGDRHRSIPLKHYAALAQVPGVKLISLQKGPGSEQLAQVNGQHSALDWGPRLDGAGAFLDTAALMQGLDLVITSDTSIAHVAGALGLRVWVALSFVPDWRWMFEREDCPWYPGMRLFRQRKRGDWGELFGRIAQALAAEAGR